eukprot:CAMPEP_0182532904 /NCGR_PEP_ID=MMETSP1323-20130603/12573_1 /TAXON_ID=236787 /ORGANISM="Florenciella parvula, Strain RCC1693" /LENGTH=92 /DNA_ID=CAMNT_0024742713 /DNA_START=500 /DNA_END=778 /DNA_ORIENTATION=+
MISQARPARWLMHLHTPDSRSQLPAFEHSTMECPFWLLFGTSATAGPSGHVLSVQSLDGCTGSVGAPHVSKHSQMALGVPRLGATHVPCPLQ